MHRKMEVTHGATRVSSIRCYSKVNSYVFHSVFLQLVLHTLCYISIIHKMFSFFGTGVLLLFSSQLFTYYTFKIFSFFLFCFWSHRKCIGKSLQTLQILCSFKLHSASKMFTNSAYWYVQPFVIMEIITGNLPGSFQEILLKIFRKLSWAFFWKL